MASPPSRIGLNPGFAVASYSGLKILAVPPCREFPIFTRIRQVAPRHINEYAYAQNSSKCAFRRGFLRPAMDSIVQSGLKESILRRGRKSNNNGLSWIIERQQHIRACFLPRHLLAFKLNKLVTFKSICMVTKQMS